MLKVHPGQGLESCLKLEPQLVSVVGWMMDQKAIEVQAPFQILSDAFNAKLLSYFFKPKNSRYNHVFDFNLKNFKSPP